VAKILLAGKKILGRSCGHGTSGRRRRAGGSPGAA